MNRRIEQNLKKVLTKQKKLSYFKKDTNFATLNQIVRNRKFIMSIIDLNEIKYKNKYTCMLEIYKYIYLTQKKDLEKQYAINLIIPKKFLRMNTLICKNHKNNDIKTIDQAFDTLNYTQKNLIQVAGLIPTTIPFIYEIPFHVNLKLSVQRQYILQNLPTVFPPLILNPHQNATVIDTCAAPGNKTSHLAAIMKNSGLIYAIERNSERFKILQENLKACGVTNTKCFNADFCETNFKAEYILVDPSCSGSGIHNSYTRNIHRLKSLSIFQFKILEKAFNNENARKIVYSTCSEEEEENEAVVQKILNKFQADWKLEKIQSDYGSRGLTKYNFFEKVLKFKRGDTIGFFCALFVRIS